MKILETARQRIKFTCVSGVKPPLAYRFGTGAGALECLYRRHGVLTPSNWYSHALCDGQADGVLSIPVLVFLSGVQRVYCEDQQRAKADNNEC